ncbi:MAG: insulinase family protein [Alkalispirochaeta sp.]
MHNAYIQLNRWDLPDYDGEGLLFRHSKSGAQVFHIRNADPENMFAFSFATIPEDSTGVAHILEHTVLSGSEQFPVKDPFLQLLKGSVNTFLNAMTYPDKTVYPAASPVARDLFNMMKVYGDAVFFPLLKRELFRQEGHRLQFREDDTLELTGVVYNEMKGNYSSHDSVAAEKCLQSLFPDTIYRHDSGGDPAAIPALTYEQFVAFHKRYYHPENVRIVLYGDIPTEEYLSFLDDEFLSRFDVGVAADPIAAQPRWDAPRRVETTYPLDGVEDLKRRSSVTVNWLLFPVTETRRLLATSVMTEILLGHSGSPLTKALIDSGLGQDLSPLYGLETDLREAVFSAGLRGTDPESTDAIEQVIFDTLSALVRDGIPADLVEGALRRVEFRNRELKSGPNGMRALRRVLRSWMYGGAPVDALGFSEDIADLRRRVEGTPRFFESLVDELLLGNTHRSTVIVRPDPKQSVREHEALEGELASKAASMSPDERSAIERDTAALRRLQETPDDPEDLKKIPFLHLADIPREVRKIECEVETSSEGVPVYRHHEFTNGIVYVDLAFDFGELSPREESLLNLLGAAVTESGLPGLPFDALNHEINLKTGGLSAFVGQQTRYGDLSKVRRLLTFRIRTLERSTREGLDLLNRIIREIDFSDTRRLEQIVDELREEMLSALIPSGHYFAGLRSAAGLHGLGRLEEEINGVTQVEHLGRFAGELDGAAPEQLGNDLAALFTALTDPRRLQINVTAGDDGIKEVLEWIPEVYATLTARRTGGPGNAGSDPGVDPSRSADTDRGTRGITPAAAPGRPPVEYLLGSSTVAYVTATLPAIRYGEDGAAAQDLLAHILRTGLLWEQIRMKGGAYGAFASSRTTEGVFSFASYRDPHTAVTLNAYRSALEALAAEKLPEEQLELAKVSMLGRELRPLTPRDAGYVDFRRRLYDITDELRQENRDLLRSVTPEEIRSVAEILLDRFSEASVAVLGGREGLAELEAERGPGIAIHELGV